MKVLSERDWRTYRGLYDSIRVRLRPPDLLIFLTCSVRTVRRRIRLRARPEEQAVSATYVRRLNNLYNQWFAEYDLSPTVVIETDRLDYVSDLVDRIDLLDTIGSTLR